MGQHCLPFPDERARFRVRKSIAFGSELPGTAGPWLTTALAEAKVSRATSFKVGWPEVEHRLGILISDLISFVGVNSLAVRVIIPGEPGCGLAISDGSGLQRKTQNIQF